jgi:branched-chain amino acid transport system substrate-binding protein
VLLIDHDERASSLLKGIKQDSILRNFKWYVSEAITGSNKLINDKETAAFAAATAMEGFNLSTEGKDAFVLGSGPPLLHYLISRNSKVQISPYAYMAWDALWLVAYTRQKIEPHQTALFKEALAQESRYYINAYSTTYRLDGNGDTASARYARYRVEKEGNNHYVWVLCGNYLKTRNFPPAVNDFTKTYYKQRGTVKIGALLPMTGQLSEVGREARGILQVAKKAANLYFASRAPGLSFSLEIYDTGTNPQKALRALKALHKKGIKACLGPYSSAELTAVEAFAAETGIILISPASSLLSLAKKDRIVRLTVSDDLQAKAIASLLEKKNIEDLLIIYQDDISGKGLMSALSSVFKGNIVRLSYDRKHLNAKSLIARAETMAGKPGKSAVLTLSLEEVADIIKAIPENSPLLRIPWFGSEGTGRMQTLIAQRKVADKAARVGFTGALFSSSGRYKTPLSDTLKASMNAGFRRLSGYGINIYDAFCLLTEPLAELGSYAGSEDLWNILKRTNYFGGIGGPFELDGNSDRTTGFFRFYSISKEKNHYQWHLTAEYENTFSVRGVLTTY